ncbi:hypothetical protein F8271_04495 [Micromonospora sp. ALFpr18c]|uniref:hypothetical protein n=1 Tax=unclassified Micromonospora TaxID=2617518 RepID=UPI00124B7F5A|nr:hypothetical protein [Micromonospora sp. ALFpr18c]KAB1947415.1 hypothetical protein F8271_04495 [Micromonospora sp. ALFpr18c]
MADTLAGRQKEQPTEVLDVDAVWVHPVTGVRTRAAFDAVFRSEHGRPVSELTVKVRMVPDATVSAAELAETWRSVRNGVEEHFNRPEHRFRRHGTLKVSVEPVTEGPAHLQVDLSHRHEQVTQSRWRPGLTGQAYAHELGHQLGLREENRHPGEPEGLLHIPGSLMGTFDDPVPAEAAAEPRGGLRQRYLDLVESLIEARRDAGPALRPSEPVVEHLPEPRMPAVGRVTERVTRMEQEQFAGPLRDLTGQRTRPLTLDEARVWAESSTALPGNPRPTTAEKWAYLRRLEQRNRATPNPPEQNADLPTPVRESRLASQDRRPWLEKDTSRPPVPTGTVRFGDQRMLPKAMPVTPGRDRPAFKLVDAIARHIGEQGGLPRPALDALAAALRNQPEQFFGEGYWLRFTRNGVPREIIVRAVNYGDWSRYSLAPTQRPQLGTTVSAFAREALTLHRPVQPKVRHIDDVHFSVTDVTDVHNPSTGTPGARFTVRNGLQWHLSDDYTAPHNRRGLPTDLVFTEQQPLGVVEVEGAGAPLHGAAELVQSVFPDFTAASPTYQNLYDFFAHRLTEHLPQMLAGWTDVPGTNPPGVRIRAIAESGRLAHASEQPPVRPQVPTTAPSGDVSGWAGSVFSNLFRSGDTLMRDDSGRYGVYDTRVRLEIQRVDGKHQPLGPGGRSTYRMAFPIPVRMRMGAGEAIRHAVEPAAAAVASPGRAAPAVLASVLVHGGDQVMVGLAEPVQAHSAVRALGVPKAGLPHLAQVNEMVKNLGAAAGVTVPPERLRILGQELLNNYPQLVGGAIIGLGRAEALITIDPTHPWKVANPSGSFDRPSSQSGAFPGGTEESATGGGAQGAGGAPAKPDGGFHSNETINGRFLTGTHSTTHSGTMGVTNANAAISGGFGVGPGPAQVAKVSVALNATMNKVSKSLTTVEDAETGMVEINRGSSTLLAYVPNWRVQLRTDPTVRWEDVPHHAVDGPAQEKLLLWVNDHYLSAAPDKTVTVRSPSAGDDAGPAPVAPGRPAAPRPALPDNPTPQQTMQHETDLRAWNDAQRRYYEQLGRHHADLHRHNEHLDLLKNHVARQGRLPDTLAAAGLTDLPKLFDNIVAELREAGLALPIGSPQRTQLWQKLSNLDTNLKKAVNHKDGYRFTIADRGHELAEVTVRTTRDTAIEQVGATTNEAPIEEVRTAIEGVSGNQAISQETKGSVSGGADLVPTTLLKMTAMAHASFSSSTSTSLGSGRTGLWVLVSRYTGFTNGYQVRLKHKATVSVANSPQAAPRPVREVCGSALLRVAEPDAFTHGFPVDEDALTDKSATVPAPGAVRGTAPQPDDPVAAPLPLHVLNGKGVGHGLIKVDEAVINDIKARLEAELRRTGFLAPDKEHPFAAGKGKRDSRVDNAHLLDKKVSEAGFDSHYDPIHQDGMAFTLTLRHKGGFTSHARITIKAGQRLQGYEDHEGNRHSPYYVRRTNEYDSVNLAMGMDWAAPGAGGGKGASTGFTVTVGYNGDKPRYKWFRGYTMGIEYFRKVSASEGLFLMVNRPELLAHPGPADIFRLPSHYTVTIDYSSSSLTMPRPIEVRNAMATVHLVPAFNNPARGGQAIFAQPTARDVIDQAVILYVDSSGVTSALRALLPDLHGPGKINDDAISKFGGNILIRSHLKEVLYREYTTDHLFDPGIWRDGTASAALGATMRSSRFAGSTADQFTLGKIKLWLSQATQTANRSRGFRIIPLSLAAGGSSPSPHSDNLDPLSFAAGGSSRHSDNLDLRGSAGGTMWWGVARSESSVRAAAKEFLELDFRRAYAFATKLDFTVDAVHEKHGKLAWASIRRPDQDTLADKEMLYLLSEPDALTAYAKDRVPVPDELLVNALTSWGDGTLQLSGNTVAGLLARRFADMWSRPELGAWRQEMSRVPLAVWASMVKARHDNGELYITGDAAARFNEMFPRLAVGSGVNPFADRWIPPYLTRTGPKALGHSGIQELKFDGDPARGIPAGSSAFSFVHAMVERAAPGLLAKRSEEWGDDDGPVLGRLQGGIDALQALLSGGREQPLVEDMLHKDGVSLVLANRIGGVLHDAVLVNLKYRMVSRPEVNDFVPGTGLENYTHGYNGRSEGKSREFGYSASAGLAGRGSLGHHNPGDPTNDLPRGDLGAGLGAKVGTGSHTSVTRAQTESNQQTVYDWNGDYRAEVRHRLDVEVRRVDLAGQFLNRPLTATYRLLAGHAQPVRASFTGTTVLKIPRSIGDARPMAGPHLPDYRALVDWPGDGYLKASLLDDAPAVARKLLADLVGSEADDPAFLSSLSLPIELSRTHLQGHLHEAIGGKEYPLGDDIFLPGRSSYRVRMSLVGDLLNLQIVAPISGNGPGALRKTQDGTSFAHSTDSPRAGWSLGADGGGATHIKDFAHQTSPWNSDTATGEAGTGADHTHNQGTAHTENYRREQHVKQQGPTYLVQMRGKFRLVARRTVANIVLPDQSGNWKWSDPFSGDVYALLTAGEVHELRQRMAKLPPRTASDTDPATSPGPRAGTPRRDLIDQLDRVGRDGYDQFAAAGEVAQRLRADVGGGPRSSSVRPPSGLVLTSREGHVIVRTFEATLAWAEQELTGLGAATELAAVRHEQQQLAELRRLADGQPSAVAARRLTEAQKIDIGITNRVIALHGDNWQEAVGRRTLPPVGLSPVQVGRQVAHELETYVDIEHTAVDGTVSRHRIDPEGRVVRLGGAGQLETVQPQGAPQTAASGAPEVAFAPSTIPLVPSFEGGSGDDETIRDERTRDVARPQPAVGNVGQPHRLTVAAVARLNSQHGEPQRPAGDATSSMEYMSSTSQQTYRPVVATNGVVRGVPNRRVA